MPIPIPGVQADPSYAPILPPPPVPVLVPVAAQTSSQLPLPGVAVPNSQVDSISTGVAQMHIAPPEPSPASPNP